MSKRIIAADTGRGFAIVVMILVHCFSHQIGQGDPAMFVPIISQMGIVTLIIVAPLIFFGVWGASFTVLSNISIAAKLSSINVGDRREIAKFLLGRAVTGLLLVVFYRVIVNLVRLPEADANLRKIGALSFNFGSGALDAIAIVGVIVPCCEVIALQWPKLRQIRNFVALFLGLAVVNLFASIFYIPWGRELGGYFHGKGLYFLELVMAKFVYGRFKIAYTLSFGFLGAAIGNMVAQELAPKTYLKVMLGLFLGCLVVLGVYTAVDWHFLLEYANEDTPAPIQFFMLGGQGLLFSVFLVRLDMGPPEKRVKAARRTTWLRRFGIPSLTIFAVGRAVANGIFWLLELFLGPAVTMDAGYPKLQWGTLPIILFLGLTLGAWFGILWLWEKAHFILSIEWLINATATLLKFKKTLSLHILDRLYAPNHPEYYLTKSARHAIANKHQNIENDTEYKGI